jgi:hypothetical protein
MHHPDNATQPETLVIALIGKHAPSWISEPQINTTNFNELPRIAIWQVTQACDLACVHCLVSAVLLCLLCVHWR